MQQTPLRGALILILLLSVSSFSVFAQKNFVDGFVVTRDKDTLRGQIDFRDWAINPKHIVFRQGETEAKEYGVADLAAFGAGDQQYESHTVHIFPYSREPERLSSEQEIGAPYDTTLFLQVLTRGKLTLWEDRTASVDYYFVNGKDGKPEQLRVITKISITDGVTAFGQEAVFHNQLNYLMADCETMARRIRNSEYNGSSLTRLFFAYNNCGKETVQKRGAGGSIQWFPLVGFESSTVKFTGDDPMIYEHYKASSGVVAGAGALFILPRKRQQLSFVTDIVWQHFHSKGDSVAVNSFINEAGHIDYSLLKLDILFRYRFPTDGIRPFVEGGMSNSLALGMNCYQGYADRIGNTNYTSPMLGGALRKYQEGWLLGAGLSGKRWTVEGRYEACTGISQATDVGSPVRSWYVMVSYAL